MPMITRPLASLLLAATLVAGCADHGDASSTSGDSRTGDDSSTGEGSSSTGEVNTNRPQPSAGPYSDCMEEECAEGMTCLRAAEVETWIEGQPITGDLHAVCAPTGCQSPDDCPVGPDGQSAACLTYNDGTGLAKCVLECPGKTDLECPQEMDCIEFFRNPGWFCV